MIFQPYFLILYVYVCVQFIGTTHFKIGSVLKEADAAGSRKTSYNGMGANTSGLHIERAFFVTVRLRSPV